MDHFIAILLNILNNLMKINLFLTVFTFMLHVFDDVHLFSRKMVFFPDVHPSQLFEGNLHIKHKH